MGLNVDLYVQEKNSEEKTLLTLRKPRIIKDWVSENICKVNNCSSVKLQRKHIERLVTFCKESHYLVEEAGLSLPWLPEHLTNPPKDWEYNSLKEIVRVGEELLKTNNFRRSKVYISFAW